ncbi:MAG: hypothetical protein U5R31_16715 [Acidimicrobiia bacterium]|nr:hypothetical protein [Acidimicrobiia bacterium]
MTTTYNYGDSYPKCGWKPAPVSVTVDSGSQQATTSYEYDDDTRTLPEDVEDPDGVDTTFDRPGHRSACWSSS